MVNNPTTNIASTEIFMTDSFFVAPEKQKTEPTVRIYPSAARPSLQLRSAAFRPPLTEGLAFVGTSIFIQLLPYKHDFTSHLLGSVQVPRSGRLRQRTYQNLEIVEEVG